MLRIVAIIPAAGKGLRYGKPKIAAKVGRNTFIDQIVQTLERAKVNSYEIVKDIETEDMLDSIRIGMKRYLQNKQRPDGWLIWPVDHPYVKPETISGLIGCFASNSSSVIVSGYQGQHGHPVVIPASLNISDKNYPGGLRQAIKDSGIKRVNLDVDDKAVLMNINRPSDQTADIYDKRN
jgi:CTP:molybdopterin cytidylyltransferase MocA